MGEKALKYIPVLRDGPMSGIALLESVTKVSGIEKRDSLVTPYMK
jgi:hypothetical protein